MISQNNTDSKLFQKELRYAVHYWNVAEAASKLFNAGGVELQKGLHIFESEWSNIESAHRWANENADQHFYAAEMMHFYANSCARFFELRRDASTWIIWLKRALETSLKHDDLKKHAITHTANLGIAYSNTGNTREALSYLRKHLALARHTNDRLAEQSAISNLGTVYRNLGRTEKSIRFFEKSLALAIALKNRAAEGNALGNLGTAYAVLNKTQLALECHVQSWSIAVELKDRRSAANKLNDIGLLMMELGQADMAIIFFQKHLETARSLGELRTEAIALGNLGKAYALKQDYVRSWKLSEEHRHIAFEIGDIRSEIVALGNLGATAGALRKNEIANDYFIRAVKLARKIGDDAAEAVGLYNHAQILAEEGKIILAFIQAEIARRIFECVGAKINSLNVQAKLKSWQTAKW